MIYLNKERNKKVNKESYYIAIDFDKTITAFKSDDSWAASGMLLPEEFQKEINELYEKYRPIEVNYTLTLEEKTQAMQTWYAECMKLYYKYNLTKQKLERFYFKK